MLVHACRQSAPPTASAAAPAQGGCVGPDFALECYFLGQPTQLSDRLTLAEKSEAAPLLELTGRLLRPDGSPASGVVLYLYHTDDAGHYTPARGDSSPLGMHGRYRGWLQVGGDGQYTLRTIRPAPYPDGGGPAHIHPVVRDPKHGDYFLTDFVFADDTLVTPDYRRSLTRWDYPGGEGVVTLTRGSDGVWRGTRNIVLK